MEQVDLTAFHRDGFAVIRVLSPEEAARYAAVADDYAQAILMGEKRNFLLAPVLPELLGHPAVQCAVSEILGGSDLVLETWKLMAIEEGGEYRQGWHRDIPLGASWLPEPMVTKLLRAIAEGRWHHNNVQCNLALKPDACYWAVPGSNRRAFTETEEAVFSPIIAQGHHLASHPDETDAGIKEGVCVRLQPGEMVMQNNILIHRGWSDPDRAQRRTLHFGFHSAHRPPTWHFRRALNDQFDRLTTTEQASMHPVLRSMLERRVLRMQDMAPSEVGDTAWRMANLSLFFEGGLKDGG